MVEGYGTGVDGTDSGTLDPGAGRRMWLVVQAGSDFSVDGVFTEDVANGRCKELNDPDVAEEYHYFPVPVPIVEGDIVEVEAHEIFAVVHSAPAEELSKDPEAGLYDAIMRVAPPERRTYTRARHLLPEDGLLIEDGYYPHIDASDPRAYIGSSQVVGTDAARVEEAFAASVARLRDTHARRIAEGQG